MVVRPEYRWTIVFVGRLRFCVREQSKRPGGLRRVLPSPAVLTLPSSALSNVPEHGDHSMDHVQPFNATLETEERKVFFFV